MRSIIHTLIAIVSCSVCVAEPVKDKDIRAAFERLSLDVPVVTVHKSLNEIRTAGARGFPYLASQSKRKELASPVFQESKGRENPKTGEFEWFRPTMGDVAVMIIVMELYPKMIQPYRQFVAFDSENVSAWIAEREGMSLAALKVAALEGSLKKATDQHADGAIAFYSGALAEATKNKLREQAVDGNTH